MEPVRREQRLVFDEVADLYLQARPSYPAALVDDLIGALGLRSGSRILELGCGPGTASMAFAERGHRLLCLEPGPRLAGIARRRLANAPGCDVVTTTFEAWPVKPNAFDLVFAAQSFHWLDPELRFSKSACALKPAGALAIFANRPLRGTARVDQDLQRAYAAYAPELESSAPATNTSENFRAMFEAAPAFGEPLCREYPWHTHYGADDYLNLLRTQSDHRLLPRARRDRLLDAIRGAIAGHGATLRVDYVAVMCWARRR